MIHDDPSAARSTPPTGLLQGRTRIWLGAALAIAATGAALVAVQRVRDNEAQAAMFAAPAPIDGNRAYTYLKQICALGPRIAGTEANTRQRQMVKAHFEKMGAKITEQPFTGEDPKTGEKVNMVNLVGSWHPERTVRVVIGAHYDTRPFPDEDPDPARRKLPFLGANDGASGVALLMEIAHHLHEDRLNTPWGVDLVLFDGEEIVYGSGPNGQVGEYFLGSKEFARRYGQGVDSGRIRYRYGAGIVLDMVGDKDLTIDQEENSVNLAPSLVRDVWNVARQIRVPQFRNRVGTSVLDDHLPLNNAGIPAIDLIDFNYPYWHTSQDIPENCSAASLEAVGKVVTAWLAQPRRRTR
ncbi:MAG: M28 family peptidase [Isosphaeraceae bacterium]